MRHNMEVTHNTFWDINYVVMVNGFWCLFFLVLNNENIQHALQQVHQMSNETLKTK